ncbi:hypothetical protein BRADI_5g03746v3 [Brachypodium distachyon]|uniref:Uncharacterized protein n=1 Tax=Brachypodium distachyon TaxID=15368 RepID=A0A0Q3KPS8_BRADI|nr:hypothetical protein BRADI_5g03746v3 [Brachypodium distachyon]
MMMMNDVSDDAEPSLSTNLSLEGMSWWTPDGKMILRRTWFPTISKLKTSELNKQHDNVTTLTRLLRKIPLIETLFETSMPNFQGENRCELRYTGRVIS